MRLVSRKAHQQSATLSIDLLRLDGPDRSHQRRKAANLPISDNWRLHAAKVESRIMRALHGISSIARDLVASEIRRPVHKLGKGNVLCVIRPCLRHSCVESVANERPCAVHSRGRGEWVKSTKAPIHWTMAGPQVASPRIWLWPVIEHLSASRRIVRTAVWSARRRDSLE